MMGSFEGPYYDDPEGHFFLRCGRKVVELNFFTTIRYFFY